MRPFHHAEHVGSLLRPARLRDAVRAHRRGDLDDEGLARAQDDAVREAIAMQEAVGLRVVTDGELRRSSYWAHWVEAIDGLGIADAVFRFHDDHGNESAFTSPSVEGRLARTRSISGAEYAAAAAVARGTVKITMPSPSTMLFWRGAGTLPRAAYPTTEAFFADLGAIFRAEIAELADAGCRYVQLDEVPLIMLADPTVRAAVDDPDALVSRYVDALNAAVAERPRDMTAALHVCRGNYKGRWLAEAGYDAIAERIFADVAVDTFFLEYDSQRAGGFEPLRFVPPDKRVVLGLLSSKTAQLEDPDDLLRRIDEAARFVDPERLGISPQCGFASTAGGNPLTEDAQRAKLALLVELAADVWPTTDTGARR